jgi:hypothetical protein
LCILVHFYLQRFGTIFTGNIACFPANDTQHVATSLCSWPGVPSRHDEEPSASSTRLDPSQPSSPVIPGDGGVSFTVRCAFSVRCLCGWNDASWNSWNILGILGVRANIHPNT